MIGIQFKVLGGEILAQRFQQAIQKAPQLLNQAMWKAVFMVERVAKRKVSGEVLKVRTGRLRSSITSRVSGTGENITGVVGTNVKYARIHELDGTIPAHTVYPRKKKALRFFYRGNIVFAKHVNIPRIEMPKRAFLSPSLKENREKIRELFRRAIEEALG